MTKETQELLARSLTAETTELLPFLPYLLQDLWELGSEPGDIVKLIEKHVPGGTESKVLDLACGKGAVSINVAKSLGLNIYGFDLITEFIEYAKEKAKELSVDGLCSFIKADANDVVNTEKNYDCTIFIAAGNILGNPRETLIKLKQTVKPGGYIILVDAFLPDGGNSENVKCDCEYISHKQWLSLFEESGLEVIEELLDKGEYDFDTDNKNINKRVNELILKYPEKRVIFEEYIKSQLNECDDLQDTVVGVTWMLQMALPGQ